jgi:hypothetical protein
MRALRLRRPAVAAVLAGLAMLALAGVTLHGLAEGRAGARPGRQAGSSYGASYQGSGSFAYPGVGEYDGERVRNSDPRMILNASYDNDY